MPVFISTLFITVAYIINPLFWINANNELNDLYYPLLIGVPSCYLWAGFILSVIQAHKQELKADKRRFLIIGGIPFCVGAFGMLQVVVLNTPTFCFGCTIMWLGFYIQNTQTLISVDDLTHLNNRGQIDRYMEQLHCSEDVEIYMMMLDINRFKRINDTFGHAEGDRALIIAAEALRQTCEQIKAPVFLGRYGGDEFTIIIQNPGENEHPEDISGMIRRMLSEKQQENALSYDLDVSIGYEKMRDKDDTAADCMKRADKKLYIDKQKNSISR